MRTPSMTTYGPAMAREKLVVVVGLQADGVRLMQRGVAEKIEAPEFMPMAQLLNDIRERGGMFLV